MISTKKIAYLRKINFSIRNGQLSKSKILMKAWKLNTLNNVKVHHCLSFIKNDFPGTNHSETPVQCISMLGKCSCR